MDLKALCKSYEWQGVTFYMIGYRNPQVDIAINDLEEVEPHFVYVNTRTGERVTEKPAALTRAEADWDKLNVPDDKRITDWELRDLWTVWQNTFVLTLPLIVAIDFPPPDVDAPMEVRMFEAFWNERNTDTAQRWQDYKTVMSVNTVNALWAAYNATRDRILEAPAALQSEPLEGDSEEKKDDAPEPSVTS